ncbi:MAG: CHAT domain-containing protein [Candidatus Eremiobacteraeota bacterium]|nr:CHAT domain-containing protein [Candidatus Eremiobacteraeota bacterium]
MAEESPVHKYKNFDVEIIKDGLSYRARVLSSPGGEGYCKFDKSPIQPASLKKFADDILIRSARARRVDEPDAATAKQLGEKLYSAIFKDDVLNCYVRSMQKCLDTEGLRIRLRFESCPELMNIPWELLYDRHNNNFLGMALRTPIIRYLELGEQIGPLVVKDRLEVLVVMAEPKGVPPLQIRAEFKNLKKALAELEAVGRVRITELKNASIDSLQEILNTKVFHVVHFIGHGIFDNTKKRGVLLFKGPDGGRKDVSGETLGIVLQHRRIRLVVINSCEGAKTHASDAFSGVAQSLVQKGVPAVVAMQFSISDDAALAFSRAFYRSLAEGAPVDRAMINARQKIVFAENWLEWATPVLYLRSESGDLFEFRSGQDSVATRTSAGRNVTAPRASAAKRPTNSPTSDLPGPALSAGPPQ